MRNHDLAKERGAVAGEAIHESGMTFEAVTAAMHYADKSTLHRKIKAAGSSFSDADCETLAALLGLRPEYLKRIGDNFTIDCPTEESLLRVNAFLESVKENAAKDQLIRELTGFDVIRLSGASGCTLYKTGKLIPTTDAHLDSIIEAARSAALSALIPSVS